MKRIFAAFLAVLCLVSAFLLPISAAESFSDALYRELRQLVKVEDFLLNEKDNGVYLLSVVESGYGEKGFDSNGGSLYLYFFNPSGKVVKPSVLNGVTMATKWDDDGVPTDYVKYGIHVEGMTENGLFFRAKVAKSARELALVNDGKRKYGISEVEIYGGGYNAEAEKVGQVYEFSGYGNSLKCVTQEFVTFKLDANQVNYISPTGEEGRYNQINSIYFTLPKEIEEEHGKLYSIKYEYYKARTKPIFVTDDETLHSSLMDFKFRNKRISDFIVFDNMKLDPDRTNQYNGYSVYGILGSYGDYRLDLGFWSGYLNGIYWSPGYWFSESYTSKSNIGLPVYVEDIEPNSIVMSASDLQREFGDVSKQYGTSESDYVRAEGKYLKSLFQILEFSKLELGARYTDYVVEEKNRDDLFDITVEVNYKWWQNLLHLKDPSSVETYEYIQSITKNDITSETFSSDFLVNDIYVDDIVKIIDNDQGDPVYILHYAVSDTYFVDEYFVGELDENGEIDDISDSKCFSVEQDVYLDFDVIYMTFGNDPAELTTIGVVMSPQDGFADVYSPPGGEPGGDKDDNKLKMILALILGLVGIVLVLWLVSQVVSFVNAAGQASYQREAKKYYKNKNKYHRRR